MQIKNYFLKSIKKPWKIQGWFIKMCQLLLKWPAH